MSITVGQLLNELEKPENADQIKHLANFKNLKHVENVEKMGGLAGLIAKVALHFTKGHMDAFVMLSECESAADIAKFKKTGHYKKIKISILDIDDLQQLENLGKLKKLEDKF